MSLHRNVIISSSKPVFTLCSPRPLLTKVLYMTVKLPIGSLPDAGKVTEVLSSCLCIEGMTKVTFPLYCQARKNPVKSFVNSSLWLPLVRMLWGEVACENHDLSLHDVIWDLSYKLQNVSQWVYWLIFAAWISSHTFKLLIVIGHWG